MPKVVDHEERRELIADALWRVVRRDGFAAVSVRSVAAETGWSTGSLRHYFSTQAELVAFAMESLIERARARIEAAGRSVHDLDGVVALLEEALPMDAHRRAESEVWLAMASASRTDPRLRRLAEEAHRGLRSLCESAVRFVVGLDRAEAGEMTRRRGGGRRGRRRAGDRPAPRAARRAGRPRHDVSPAPATTADIRRIARACSGSGGVGQYLLRVIGLSNARSRVARRLVARASGGGPVDLSSLESVPRRLLRPLRRDGLDPVTRLGTTVPEPVHRLAHMFGMNIWLVSGHEEAKTVLADQGSFSNDIRPYVGASGSSVGGLGFTDPPVHTRLRSLLTPEFTMRRINRLAPRIEAIVDAQLDQLEARGPVVDLVEHFAFPVPFLVICELLGPPGRGPREVPHPQPRALRRLGRGHGGLRGDLRVAGLPARGDPPAARGARATGCSGASSPRSVTR